MSSNLNAPDLTQRPPRSARVRLGGYVLFARILDKCRASLAGKNGEFKFDSGLDQHFFNYVGVEAEALKVAVSTGKSDGEMLVWLEENANCKRTPWEIKQWSAYQDERVPDGDAETRALYDRLVGQFTTTREDIKTWMDYLDLDDYCTFGGQP